MSKRLARKKKPLRVRLSLTCQDVLLLQDAIDERGTLPNKHAEARRAALQRRLHGLTGEELPPTRGAFDVANGAAR